MNRYSDDMRRCLSELDAVGLRRLWKHEFPHLPMPTTDAGMLIAMHHARTQAHSVMFRLRAYSHRWLVDNGYPSGLPDELRPRAERVYPKIVEGVGIAVRAVSPILAPVAAAVGLAMARVVADCYANGDRDPVLVKRLMMQARDNTKKTFADLFEQARQSTAH